MYKLVASKPDWLKTDQVIDIYSVSNCISEDFDDWINYWKHNGYWFFDTPEIIESLANESAIDLANMQLFFYQVYDFQWDDETGEWEDFGPERSFQTNVRIPKVSMLEGYDVTTFTAQTCAECSPLSCNHMAAEIKVNSHCLLDSFEEAKRLIESGKLHQCEPGPYRIFGVYRVDV